MSLLSCHCKQEIHLLRWLHSKIHVQKTFPVIFTDFFFFFSCYSCPKCYFYIQALGLFFKSFLPSSASPLLPRWVRPELPGLGRVPSLSSCCPQLLRDFWLLTDLIALCSSEYFKRKWGIYWLPNFTVLLWAGRGRYQSLVDSWWWFWVPEASLFLDKGMLCNISVQGMIYLFPSTSYP